MLKALFKKQLMEVNVWLIQDKKNGKTRSRGGVAALILLYAALFVYLGVAFALFAIRICGPLVSEGFDWLYFALMGLMALAIGVFGSVFTTYATLYRARDNEFLLSMPIPPAYILMVRLFGVWTWCLIYEAVAFVPTMIVYWRELAGDAGLSAAVVLSDIALMLILSFFILTLVCVLGWGVAKLSVKMKNRSFAVVILSLAFIALYYWGYSKVFEALRYITDHAQEVGERIRGSLYPMYLAGRAGAGDGLTLLFCALAVAVIFAFTYWVMSRSFIRIATASQEAAKRVYRETAASAKSKGMALLGKELKRFTSSSVYMLNCGLGTVLMPIAGVAILVKADLVHEFIEKFPGEAPEFVLLVLAAALCTMTSMNDISAPSVSLEGKNLWLVQSLPVSAWQVLKAKLGLHLLITEIPVTFCAVCFAIVVRPGALGAVMLVVLPMLYVLMSASFGLMINLKAPNLKWTSEMVPIKQSMGVMVAMFGGVLFVALLVGLYFVLRIFLSPKAYLLLVAALIAVLCAVLLSWLKNKGAKIFSEL